MMTPIPMPWAIPPLRSERIGKATPMRARIRLTKTKAILPCRSVS